MKSATSLTLAERMRRALPGMSPGERRIVRLCLALNAPEELATVAIMAEAAGVSPPTVLRALDKIGFDHFGAFREVALAEIAARHQSAFAQMRRGTASSDPLAAMLKALGDAVRDTFDRLDQGELANAIDLLADPRLRQIFTGGRFSHSLAEQLHAHVNLMRPGTELLSYSGHGRTSRLVDIGRSHVVTLFDFRRYERETVELAHGAKRKRAKIVLITDQWMSPIADWADAVLVAEVQSASPFDTMVPGLALVETMISMLHARLSGAAERLAQFETASGRFEWGGFDAAAQDASLSIGELGDHGE